jgi:hypothetical protein
MTRYADDLLTPYDAAVLDRAARIIRRRSRRPEGLACRVICKVLTDLAAKIRDEGGQAEIIHTGELRFSQPAATRVDTR